MQEQTATLTNSSSTRKKITHAQSLVEQQQTLLLSGLGAGVALPAMPQAAKPVAAPVPPPTAVLPKSALPPQAFPLPATPRVANPTAAPSPTRVSKSVAQDAVAMLLLSVVS